MRVQHVNNRRKRVLFLRILLVCIVAAVIVFAGYLYHLRRPEAKPEGLAEPFSFRVEDGTGKLSDFALESAEPFTADLVVSEPNVRMGDFSLTGWNTRGLLFNLESREPMYASGIYDRIYPASITKVMTAILVLEWGELGAEVTMEEQDFALETAAQKTGLKAGDTLTVEQLLHCLLVYSGNDAAMALARTVSGTVERFVEQMNTKAHALGMTGTHFVNPHGLHDEEHYTTLYDIYLMMQEAGRYEEFSTISRRDMSLIEAKTESGDTRTLALYATDLYLAGTVALPGGLTILASKTGSTSSAGYCLSLIVQDRYGIPYVAVVTGAPSQDELYTNMTAMLEQIGAGG